ncbi:MAG: VOC family protein [Ignavibacteriales bacterium]|nr:VOC family protein [Ignavibacteriales bacterium]
MAAPVTHFEINAKDGKRSQEFYAGLFDWKIKVVPEMNYGLVDTGWKGGIGGGIGQVDENTGPSATFYVQVEDVQAYLDKAVRLGGKIVQPLVEVPDMVTFGLFADPDGNVIGIVKGPQTPPKEAKPKKKTAKKKTTKAKKPARKTKRRK